MSIQQILESLTAGETIDLDNPDLATILDDPGSRQEIVTSVIDHFEIEPLQDEAGQEEARRFSESREGFGEFMGGLMTFLAMRDVMEMGLEPSPETMASQVDSSPVPADVTEAQVNDALQLLANSFYVESNYGSTMRITADGFHVPNFSLATISLELDTPTSPPKSIRLDAQGQLDEMFESTTEPDASTPPGDTGGGATGTLSLEVPTRFEHISFCHDDNDAPKSSGSVTAALEHCTNDCVKITLSGIENEEAVLLVARDERGQRLERREYQTQTRPDFTTDQRFGGRIHTIDVFVAIETTRRELPVTADAVPTFVYGEPTEISRPRYRPPTGSKTYRDVTSAELAETEVVAGRMSSVCEFNQCDLHAHLPRSENSAFAQVEFLQTEIRDISGRRLSLDEGEIEQMGRGYDEAAHCSRVSFESESGDAIDFESIEGELSVTYPLTIAEVQLSQDEPVRAGLRVEFDGSTMRLEADPSRISPGFGATWWSSPFVNDQTRVRAWDATGQEIRMAVQGSQGDEIYEATFWGIPTRVQVLVVTETDSMCLRYQASPAPLLPDSCCGIRSYESQCRPADSVTPTIEAEAQSSTLDPPTYDPGSTPLTLPQPRELYIPQETLDHEYLKIEIDRCEDPEWHFSLGIHRSSQYGPQGANSPTPQDPLVTLALFHREDHGADLEVLGGRLSAEIEPNDWLGQWIEQNGITPISSLPTETPNGTLGDVVGTWDTDEGQFVGRFATLRWDDRLFLLVLRAPAYGYGAMADPFFLALSTFEPFQA